MLSNEVFVIVIGVVKGNWLGVNVCHEVVICLLW